MNQAFIGGPKNGTAETYPSAVPPQVVLVYAEVDGMLCADEQVTKLLGRYVRKSQILERGKKSGKWVYYWESTDDHV